MILKRRPTGRIRGSNESVSRVEVTRPATDPYLTGQSASGGSGWVRSGGAQNLKDDVGSGQEVLKNREPGRVGSGAFQISRTGIGLDQEISEPDLTREV